MTQKCFTWNEFVPMPERVLLIINSQPNDYSSVDLVMEALGKLIPIQSLLVVGNSYWQDYLIKKTEIPKAQILFSCIQNQELELNYFLENSLTISWIKRHKPQLITGSLAHNLYNEEVKEVFEKRICLFIEDGVFLAHSLPNEYLYILRIRDLFERFSRQKKIDIYKAKSEAIVDEFYHLWIKEGKPAIDDRIGFEEEKNILYKHLGKDLDAFDETGEIPLENIDVLTDVADYWNSTLSSYLVKLENEIIQRESLQAEHNALLDEINNIMKTYPFIRILRWVENRVKQILKRE